MCHLLLILKRHDRILIKFYHKHIMMMEKDEKSIILMRGDVYIGYYTKRY